MDFPPRRGDCPVRSSLTRPETYNGCARLFASLQDFGMFRQRLWRVAEPSGGEAWRKSSELTSSILAVPAGTVR